MHIPHIQCKSHWKNTKVQIRAKMWLSYEWVFGFNALKLIEMHRVLRPSETGLFLWVFSFSWSFRPSPASTFPPFGPFTLACLLFFFLFAGFLFLFVWHGTCTVCIKWFRCENLVLILYLLIESLRHIISSARICGSIRASTTPTSSIRLKTANGNHRENDDKAHDNI